MYTFLTSAEHTGEFMAHVPAAFHAIDTGQEYGCVAETRRVWREREERPPN